jgi:hypothetical protein
VATLSYKYNPTTVLTVLDLSNFATNWWTAVGTAWKNAVDINVTFVSVTVTDMGQDPPLQYVLVLPPATVGLIGGDATPANASIAVAWKTPYASRKRRGRMFFFGLPESGTVASLIGGTYAGLIGVVASTITTFTNIGFVPMQFAVWSRVANIVTPVTAYLIDTAIDSQKRRLLNRGN